MSTELQITSNVHKSICDRGHNAYENIVKYTYISVHRTYLCIFNVVIEFIEYSSDTFNFRLRIDEAATHNKKNK